jgi:hypothetical protein
VPGNPPSPARLKLNREMGWRQRAKALPAQAKAMHRPSHPLNMMEDS